MINDLKEVLEWELKEDYELVTEINYSLGNALFSCFSYFYKTVCNLIKKNNNDVKVIILKKKKKAVPVIDKQIEH